MCGIFCNIYNKNSKETEERIKRDLRIQLKNAAKRGRDSVGMVVLCGKLSPVIIKKVTDPYLFIKDKEYVNFVDKAIKYYQENDHDLIIIGQCRLANSGSRVTSSALQPIIKENVIGVFNGLITDHFDKKIFSSDSDYIFNRINTLVSTDSLNTIFSGMNGSINLIIYNKIKSSIQLVSNIGSLYYGSLNKNIFIASENKFLYKLSIQNIKKVENGFLEVYKSNSELNTFIENKSWQKKLKRCSKCILPETYPLITFNKYGVCNFCTNYKNQVFHGANKLYEFLNKYKKKYGNDCIVGLSGGRDSCYGLYYIKKVMKMNPIAYTYDWGLTTEVSRRNQSLICEKLGVEHIVRSANLEKKRRFVRKNVNAWIKKPKLGMIPLFMAGDKDFYEYGRTLGKENEIDLTILCTGHQMEQREFMIGFAGIAQPKLRNNPDFFHYPNIVKVRLALWYSLQYFCNPRYINESLYDSIRSYFISFFKRTNQFLNLFHYIPWDEDEIERVLYDEIGLEKDLKFGKNQWRMGDGQTAFNNFIYYHMSGLTEFDSFRSHQIRERLITREKALELIEEENIPKYDSIREFCETIGLPYEETMKNILNINPIFKNEK